ncbi:MAG: ABC transporter substrate-binding protein [Anaerolineales bacterium]
MKTFKTKTLLLFLILTVSILASACQPSSEAESTLHYGLTLAPSGIDPHLNASAELGIPLNSVYDTLVFLDPESREFVSGLAERWQLSSDGLRYTFYLRKDVRFHDGTPFNAQAVQENLDYILDPDNHSQKAATMLGPLNQTEILDEHTIAFVLDEPFAPLLDSLSQVYLGMASPTALNQWGASEYQFHQVGTGPYRFIEYIPNDHITLERNPDYAWGPSIYDNTKASVERIIFYFYEDAASRALALERREVDILGEVPPQEADRLASSVDFSLSPVAIPGQPLQFFFNTAASPTDDLRVRQALLLAVDKKSIVLTVFGSHSPISNGPLSQVGFEWISELPPSSHNPEGARKLLEEAGWILESSEPYRIRDGEPLVIKLIAPPWGSNSEVAQLLKAGWENIGIDVELTIAPGFGMLKKVQTSGDYHAIGINFFGTDPDLLRSFYASDGFYNWTGFSDPEIDRMLNEAARSSLAPDHRKELYNQIVQAITNNALVLPIRDYVNLVVFHQRIEGLKFSAQGWFPTLIDIQLSSP